MTTENNLQTDETPVPQDAPEIEEQPAEAPASEGEGGAPEVAEAEEAEEGRNRSQERIRELIAERKALEEYATYWRNKALESIQQAQPKAAEPEETPAPKLEDFDTTEQWAAAFQKWTEERVERKAEAVAHRIARQRQEELQRASIQAEWQERLAKFSEQHPDAQAVIANPTLPITKTMSEVITASENGPALAYHLGKNPAEAARIARMSPTQQAAALGRLEAKLASAPAPQPRKPRVSRAPAPPAPIDGAGTPSVDLENCSLSEFLERRLGKRKRV
jgi:hypothetical protein